MKRLVAVVEVFALVCAAVFVIGLFTFEESGGPVGGDGVYDYGAGSGDEQAEDSPGAPDGAALYASSCAACHGSGGEGGSAPDVRGPLGFESADAEAAFVANPPNARMANAVERSGLSPEEILAIVEYLRDSEG